VEEERESPGALEPAVAVAVGMAVAVEDLAVEVADLVDMAVRLSAGAAVPAADSSVARSSP